MRVHLSFKTCLIACCKIYCKIHNCFTRNVFFTEKDDAKNGISQKTNTSSTSPQDGSEGRELITFEVIGSAESLVGRVLASQGLGKYCDPDFVAKELSEALDMTRDQMDREAFLILKETEGARLQQNMSPELEISFRRQNTRQN